MQLAHGIIPEYETPDQFGDIPGNDETCETETAIKRESRTGQAHQGRHQLLGSNVSKLVESAQNTRRSRRRHEGDERAIQESEF